MLFWFMCYVSVVMSSKPIQNYVPIFLFFSVFEYRDQFDKKMSKSDNCYRVWSTKYGELKNLDRTYLACLETEKPILLFFSIFWSQGLSILIKSELVTPV